MHVCEKWIGNMYSVESTSQGFNRKNRADPHIERFEE